MRMIPRMFNIFVVSIRRIYRRRSWILIHVRYNVWGNVLSCIFYRNRFLFVMMYEWYKQISYDVEKTINKLLETTFVTIMIMLLMNQIRFVMTMKTMYTDNVMSLDEFNIQFIVSTYVVLIVCFDRTYYI